METSILMISHLKICFLLLDILSNIIIPGDKYKYEKVVEVVIEANHIL